MRPFDYEAAKAGAKVCFADGRPARVQFFAEPLNPLFYPIMVYSDCGRVGGYYKDGTREYVDDSCILMMEE